MRILVNKTNVPALDEEYGEHHLYQMIDMIDKEIVTGEKAHRWLGYIQGVVVSNGGATLSDVKSVNFIA